MLTQPANLDPFAHYYFQLLFLSCILSSALLITVPVARNFAATNSANGGCIALGAVVVTTTIVIRNVCSCSKKIVKFKD